MLRTTFLIALATVGCSTAQGEPPAAWKSAAHRAGICGEIKKLDTLLYDNPGIHGRTATCTTSDNWILVKPNQELPEERMQRFVLLAFTSTGSLFNEDFAMPDNVYVGYDRNCQVMTTYAASVLNKDLRAGDKLGFQLAYMRRRTPSGCRAPSEPHTLDANLGPIPA